MKGKFGLLAIAVLFALAHGAAQQAATPASPQAKAPSSPPTIAQVFDRSLSGVERDIVPAAEEMPEDKYSYVPSQGEYKGVRNFGQQVRHVAATNFAVFAAILGEKPPVEIGPGEAGPESVKTKAELVKLLKDSFAYGHKALATLNESNLTTSVDSPFGQGNKTTRLSLAILSVGHAFDHYGQIVEYLRLNGIVPPASRPRR